MCKNKNNFIAIIPARSGSKEVKNKNVIKIEGHPLIAYSIEAAKKSKFVENVFVTTDGKYIAKVARQYGAKVIFRPKQISKHTSQIEDAILHAIEYVEKFYKKEVENIVLMQPTSPLRNKDDLDNAIKKFIKDKADSLFSCINNHPLVWQYKNYKLSPLNYNPFKRPSRQTMLPTLIENGSIYVTKKKIYKAKKSRLAGKISSYVMESYSKMELDAKKDLKFLSAFMKPKNIKMFNLINPKKIK